MRSMAAPLFPNWKYTAAKRRDYQRMQARLTPT
jgi:hypothetical protein